MELSGRKALVTGAGGFIGSHLCEALAAAGADVRALVHYNALGRRGWLEETPRAREFEIVAGDIADADSVARAVEGCSVVFHLAALIGIPYSYNAPRAYLRTNAEGTLNVLQAARLHGVERVVTTSTSEVYGTAQRAPIDETHPLAAQSPYAASKIAADKLAESFHYSFGAPVVVARPFNTYGPRQSARAIVPTIIGQCLAGDGTMRLGNLDPTRDLNYVEDTVAGFIAAASVANVEGRAFNLGGGHEVSVGELARRIAVLCGREGMPIEQDAARARPRGSEVERLVADATRARETLGWTPRIGLDEGLRRTIDWWRERPQSMRAGEYTV